MRLDQTNSLLSLSKNLFSIFQLKQKEESISIEKITSSFQEALQDNIASNCGSFQIWACFQFSKKKPNSQVAIFNNFMFCF